MDDFDRALRRIELEEEPAGRHRKDLEHRATLLLGELRANRRLLEESEFSDLRLLDESPEVLLLDLEHWREHKIAEVLRILPELRPALIDLDQAGVFKYEYLLARDSKPGSGLRLLRRMALPLRRLAGRANYQPRRRGH